MYVYVAVGAGRRCSGEVGAGRDGRMHKGCRWLGRVRAAPESWREGTAARWMQSGTGVPTRGREAAQEDTGQDGGASAQRIGALAWTTRGGAGAGGECTGRAWERTGGGRGARRMRGEDTVARGNGTGRAWRGGRCSGLGSGGGAVVT
jgi:hypothetical protein